MNYFMVNVFVVCLTTCPAKLIADNSFKRRDDSLAGRPPWRRLFLDAMVVEELHGLTRVFHSVEKYDGNPVLTKDRPWEGWGPYLYGTVMWDDGRLKMWYQCIGQGSGCVCYAESEDGLKWQKPNLGLIEYDGSTTNNIISSEFSIPSVFKISTPDSPEHHWRMYGFGRKIGVQLASSPDGLNWQLQSPEEHLFQSSDVVNFFYDVYEQRYVATYKTHNRRHRAVGIALSPNGLTWHKPVEGAVFGADDLDPDPIQVYGMPAFPYQGVYIGLPWIYHARFYKYGAYTVPRMHEAQEDSLRTIDVQLAWSWNLISWTRPPERQPFIPLGEKESWDSGMIFTARAPVIVNDKLCFYYGGFDKVHDDYKGIKGAIGVATIRPDGFCSMQADNEEGWLISRREVFHQPKVFINARTEPNGYVVAEFLDRHNRVIKGFSRSDCLPFKGDSIRSPIEWKTKAFPANLVVTDKKIRFYLKDADLYSYLPADIDVQQDPENRLLH